MSLIPYFLKRCFVCGSLLGKDYGNVEYDYSENRVIKRGKVNVCGKCLDAIELSSKEVEDKLND